MPDFLRIILFLVGLIFVGEALLSALRTFVLPRSSSDWLVRLVFAGMRKIFDGIMRFTGSYRTRDRIFAYYAPMSLLTLLPVWLLIVLIGFGLINFALGIEPFFYAHTVSGSSLLTLGFARGETYLEIVLAFVEATIGLILVALLIAYLPTMYSAFSAREQAVTMLDALAGSPPSPVEMIARFHRIGRLEKLQSFWEDWEAWFASLAESHTSLAALVYFRSPQPEDSWINAAATVLDSGALMMSVVNVPWEPQAALTVRVGYTALRQISRAFRIDYNPDPKYPVDPISITRADFEQACELLEQHNVPLKPDREQAWEVFAGWRVNYDSVLDELSSLAMAPAYHGIHYTPMS